MKPYLLALDQGTTSSRCILFDRHGTVLSRVNREFRQSYPQDGWVEQDATEILASQMGVAVEAMLRAGIGAEEIASRISGKPLSSGIASRESRSVPQSSGSADGRQSVAPN